MTAGELQARLSQGGALLHIDTNAMWRGNLFDIADAVSMWNLGRTQDQQLKVALSALAYGERLAQERRRRGAKFDIHIISNYLMSKGIEIAPIDDGAAEAISAWLAQRAPTDESWDRLKVERLRRELGLSEEAMASKRASATVDWFIAGHSGALGAILVTDDQGPEFEGVDCVSRAALLTALESAPQSP